MSNILLSIPPSGAVSGRGSAAPPVGRAAVVEVGQRLADGGVDDGAAGAVFT
jgi:hypothetical protein